MEKEIGVEETRMVEELVRRLMAELGKQGELEVWRNPNENRIRIRVRTGDQKFQTQVSPENVEFSLQAVEKGLRKWVDALPRRKTP